MNDNTALLERPGLDQPIPRVCRHTDIIAAYHPPLKRHRIKARRPGRALGCHQLPILHPHRFPNATTRRGSITGGLNPPANMAARRPDVIG